MNFSVEVDAETNPLTNDDLVRILRSAASNNQNQIQSGTKQLQNWEKTPGFYSSLQSIYIERSLPEEVRYLAILQLKNGIDKYWRKTAQNALRKEEKNLIRSRSLESCLDEPSAWLALQGAIANARIVRYEFPHDWPDAISSIVDSLRASSEATTTSIRLPRSLLVLLHVVKELSTARLQRSQAALQSAAPSIAEALFPAFHRSVQRWMTFLFEGGDDEGGAMDSMEHSLLALRVLRRLVLRYDFPNRHRETQDVWTFITQQFGAMLPLTSPTHATKLTLGPRKLVERHLLQFSKLHLNVARNQPASFALLPDSINLVRSYWLLVRQFSENYGLDPEALGVDIGSDGDQENEMSFQEQLALKALLLLRACEKMASHPIQSFKYQKDEDKEEKRLAREAMQLQLFSPEFAREVMEVMMTRYFAFTARDLRQWEEEPDEWEKTQEGAGDDWEFSIRTCAEKLFLDLIIDYKDFLVPALIQLLQNSGIQETDNILRKDSIYAAIGLAAPVLEQKFDFGPFLTSSLVPESRYSGPGGNILRRRIAIVLSKWVPIRGDINGPLIYEIFQNMLDKTDHSNDQVVRVTAGRQLHEIIDPFEFKPIDFARYCPTIVSSLLALIEEVDLTETKLALLNTLSLIVVKLEHQIVPVADQILSLLPAIWSQANEEYIIKQSILGILSRLITSLKGDSAQYHSLIIPLIQSSIEPDSQVRQYLLEDALDLWHAVVEQAQAPPSPELLALLRNLFPLFEIGSDALKKAFDITEAYIYLIPTEILESVVFLLNPLAELMRNMKKTATGVITRLVELLVRSADSIGGLAAVERLAEPLISSSILPLLVSDIKASYDAKQTTGPNRLISPIDGIIESDYFSVVARLALASPQLVISAVKASSQEPSAQWLLTEWFAQMDDISSSDQKKLSCFALTALLELDEPWVFGFLQSYMSMWTDVINEIVYEWADDNNQFKKVDCIVYASPQKLQPDEGESPGDFRQRLLNYGDPINLIDVRDFIRERLGKAVERSGGVQAFQQQWVENVDKDVVQAFGELGIF